MEKILIVNKFLYPRGGDCIHTLSLGRLLEAAGHEVRYYAMNYPENIPDKDTTYFAEEVSFAAKGWQGKTKAIGRILWGTGVKQGFVKLLDEFQPDVIHLNNIHSYLSPIVAQLAHNRGIRVLWTLHDYKLICPTYSSLRQGKVCEECFVNKKNVVLRKCMKGSFIASCLAWMEAVNWNRDKLCQWTDAFICPSNFMKEKMLQGGFPTDKLHVLCNFIEENQSAPSSFLEKREKAYAYIGRLSEEKGIEGLLDVAQQLPYKLYIAGSGPLAGKLKPKYASSDKIVFLGRLSSAQTAELLKQVQFSIIPSIWHENNPLSAIESLCCGTPVLGRRMGGIPELLETNNCNLLFDKDEELPNVIAEMFVSSCQIDRYSLSTTSLQRFSKERYYQEWLKLIR